MRVDFPRPLIRGRLIKRYKRFLADVTLDDGSVVVAHCPNTGKMTGCSEPGCVVWLEPAAPQAKRKLRWTWVITERLDGVPVGVHTTYPNRLAAAAIERGFLPGLEGYATIRREVKMGERHRVDIHCSGHSSRSPAWVEVKNVTLVEDGVALFPDAVTERGRKHLSALEERIEAGDRAAMVYVLQRGDAAEVRPADAVDPEYGRALRRAAARGVETHALVVHASPDGLEVTARLPVVLP